MNIGIFTDSYYPEVSGLVTSISILQKELKKRGHQVYIFSTSNPGVHSKNNGVFRLPSMSFFFYKSKRMGVFYTPRAAKCVKRLKLDIIHTQTEFGLGIFGKIMAKEMGIPVVHTYHTMYKDYIKYISKGKFKKLSDDFVKMGSRKVCNTCDAVIAPTSKVQNLLKDYGVEKPIEVIPTGIELDRFKKENHSETDLLQLKEKFKIKADDPVILFLGRVAKEKSVDAILRQMPKVLKQISNAKFLIVGDGPLTGELKELAKELNIENSVIFTGEQPWDQIGKFYRLGDVFISSSVTETQGLTLIEAMASDVPVAAKNDESIEELIKNNINGRIFNSEEDIADVIIEILLNKELSENFVLNARETVNQYSSEQFGENVEQLYFKVLKNNIKVKKKGYIGLKKTFKTLKNLKNLRVSKTNS